MLTRFLIALARLAAVFLALGILAGWCMLGWGCIERRAHAAPRPFVAPKPKPKPVAAWPIGTHEVEWNGTRGGMRFLPDGRYLHRHGGAAYAGSWERQGDSLAVVEGLVGSDGVPGAPKRWWMPWEGPEKRETEATGEYGTTHLRMDRHPPDAGKDGRPAR